jgi:hypothetical protein
VEAARTALSGIAAGVNIDDLAAQLAPLHPKHNTFPAEVLLDLAADAIDDASGSRQDPIRLYELADRDSVQRRPRTRTQEHKYRYALHAAAMIRAGVEPDLFDEVGAWRTDDLWVWALDALVT